ncbi:RNA 2',3'-cyclic phosphodiesterase [Pararhodospirillum oryzae]|uniref:RNA 2',3'-cyclic phosphodiesterase n=1 Tax=Pararhodospirillum oryzae TaxID=478448 RepID=A0A512H666_9PROT|nr:RNA 2',3'-cyclic phosphodiesterase [Pararhodospirillum oryzae]GEO80918.1 RNA 2',3'-cyclic phosphodiesterase [Pararhodospirillum oryzae]
MIRLFVALVPPQSVRGSLADLGRGIPGVRWMPPESLHLTLRFLGEVEEGLAREIDAALLGVRWSPVPVRLRDLGVFGKGARRHTLWAGVEPGPALAGLKGRIDASLRPLGIAGDARQFSPHITLARLTRPHEERLQAFIEGASLLVGGTFVADSFTLFSSHLGREGPHYEPWATYPLEEPRG